MWPGKVPDLREIKDLHSRRRSSQLRKTSFSELSLLSEKVPSCLDDFFLVQPKVYFCEKIYKNVVLL